MPRPRRALLFAPLLVLAACGGTAHAQSTQPAPEPPSTALMICSDDIKSKVGQAVRLDAPPKTHDTWAGGVYTCHYDLPMGMLMVSDQVFPDAAAARSHMAAQQGSVANSRQLAGLGQQAYGTPAGVAVVLKGDQILTVDATALPERFGANDQKRTDLAYEVASDVLGCWTGDD